MEKQKKSFKSGLPGPERIDIILKDNAGLTRGQAQKLIDAKNVFIGGTPAKSYHVKVRPGMLVEYVEDFPQDRKTSRPDIPLDIIYEDGHMLAVNKQAGLVSHPAPGHYEDTLLNALLGGYIKKEDFPGHEDRLGIVHRLDKDTTGVMIVAKNSASFTALRRMFKDREIVKYYNCLVHGMVEKEGFLSTMISRDARNRRRFSASGDFGKDAQTIFEPVENFWNSALLKVRILTGRTHQIRVHMKFLKHEIIGDPFYGDKNKDYALLEYLGYDRKSHPDILKRQMLHAASLEFDHPVTGKKMLIEAGLPDDFSGIAKMLRKRTRGGV
ncbi:MAG TPA: RluA family pseudouridine synthase [bacterium]|nr:RluA family pseudouridine synthase [bacterium]